MPPIGRGAPLAAMKMQRVRKQGSKSENLQKDVRDIDDVDDDDDDDGTGQFIVSWTEVKAAQVLEMI